MNDIPNPGTRSPTPLVRVALIGGGSIALGLGLLGIWIPVLPTTPFLLVAAACFARSSDRLIQWMLDHPRLGPAIESWRRDQSIPGPVKYGSLFVAWTAIGTAVVFVVEPTWLRVLLVGVLLAKTVVMVSIPTRERPARVGPSGAGKTTVGHLLLSLLHPAAGTVRVGGRAVLVPQRPFLFHGSVADNLRLAKPAALDAELWAVLEAADLADLITQRREGLDIPVGEWGLRLSGGEAQRLAIARALLVDAAVVVLDEPTSNVDPDTEARIRLALDRLTRDRTLLVS